MTVSLPTDRDWLTPEEYNAYRAATARKGNKFGAIPTVVDGHRFDSLGEADRWSDLRQLERAGAIADLRRQVAYDLHAAGGAVIGRIVLDFVYTEGGAITYEDYKGGKATMTPLWRWKRKHFEREYEATIRITGR